MEQDDKNVRIQHRTFDFAPDNIRTVDEERRIVELSFSSETPVERWGCYEILSHSDGAVMLERLNTSGCLLFNHDRNKVIGKILKAEIKDKRGIARVQFDDDEQSLIYYNKVKNGTLRNTSVGYHMHEVRREATGKGNDLKVTETATLWEPLEVSIVSVPADYSVGVGRDMPLHCDDGVRKANVINRPVLNERQLKYNQNLTKK